MPNPNAIVAANVYKSSKGFIEKKLVMRTERNMVVSGKSDIKHGNAGNTKLTNHNLRLVALPAALGLVLPTL